MSPNPPGKKVRVKLRDAGYTYILKAGMWSPREDAEEQDEPAHK